MLYPRKELAKKAVMISDTIRMLHSRLTLNGFLNGNIIIKIFSITDLMHELPSYV